MSEKLDWVKALEEMADLQHYYATGDDRTEDEIDAWEAAGGLDNVSEEPWPTMKREYLFDDDGNEYWLDVDGRRHYTRLEG